MKRIARFLHKYGILGICKVLHWKQVKAVGKVHARLVYKKAFRLELKKRDTLYALQPDDRNRLLKGEKKILFYDPACALSQKDIKFQWEALRNQDCFALVHYIDDPEAEKALLPMLDKALSEELTNTVAMEASIRAINIIETARLIERKKTIPDALKIQIESYIKKCLIFVFCNLEKGIGYSGNHYFFNLLGICWILNSISADSYVKRIKKRYLRTFEKALAAMLNDDGSLYECSTYYHRYVTEAFLEFLYYNPDLRNKNLDALAKRMAEFCIYASDDGRLFGFGDNDSGRVLPLPCYYSYSSRDLSVIMMLADKLNIKLQNPSIDDYQSGSRFGVFKIQSDEWTAAVRCDEIQDSRKNKTIGVHAHNDQLAVLVSYKGKEIFVDSGTYLYVSDDDSRVNNLKTDRHSTIVVSGAEQNAIYNSWKYTERTAKGRVVKNNGKCIDAALRISGIDLKRKVSVDTEGCSLRIDDSCDDPNDGVVYGNFILSHQCRMMHIEEKRVLWTLDGITFEMISENPMEISTCCISGEYGEQTETKRIRVRLENNRNCVRVKKLTAKQAL